ncbi:MAG TPA: 8-amino-7-oxononanoate synthase [Candidatus Binatia bacterium]|nr:8-amino-7-oxononanoate synthase [Candidatus Binatia bacterium]
MPNPGLEARLEAELERIRAQNLYRTRRVIDGAHGAHITVNGRACVNFCSNDYLGLASDPRIAEAARAALAASGTGSGAAALISGYNREHRALEEELADFTRRPRALLFSSGWAANLGVMRALLRREDTLVADELNHASLIDGGRLSGARYVRVRHADLEGFGRALSQAAGAAGKGTTLVATDSVFSMDGDIAPLAELGGLCQQHGATLIVDDAHGFGVLGVGDRGALFTNPESNVAKAEIYVATLGKALGCSGAFVAGSENLIEFLIQRARSWVFSTAPPPALAAAARAALRIVSSQEGQQRRAQLFDNVRRFRGGWAQLGLAPALQSAIRNPQSAIATPIQPIVLGDERRALRLSEALFERGLWVAAIRPPTVPPGTARLRITLSGAHSPAQVDALLEALAAELRAAA